MTDERLTPRDGRSRAPARPRKINRLTPEERKARGNAARNECPRSGHGHWSPATSRPDPIAQLEDQAATRVPELVPLRYGRMLVSPFTFYRGAALIMASDLAAPHARDSTPSCAVTPTCPTSACSLHLSGS
jgi:hypothetical protein